MYACRTAQSHCLERAGAGVTGGGKTVSQSAEGTGLAAVVVPAVQNQLGDTPPGVCATVSLERIN